MTLPACTRQRPAAAPPPIAVPVKDLPSADLLVCAVRPAKLPEDQLATIPAPLRRALIGLATAFGANADQLDRLVNWIDPTAGCNPTEKK